MDGDMFILSHISNILGSSWREADASRAEVQTGVLQAVYLSLCAH